MTELEWGACADPEPMVMALRTEKYQCELRLFGVHCVRRVWELLPEECRWAIEVAEQFAHDAASASELRAAFDSAVPVIDAVWSGGRSPDALAYATQAVGDAVGSYPRTPATVLSATGAAASAVGCTAAEADEADYDAAFEAAREAELAVQAEMLRDLIPHPFNPTAA